MTELIKATPNKVQIIINLELALKQFAEELPSGADIQCLQTSGDWCLVNRINHPYSCIYRITLPKPAPHPTILSAIEHDLIPTCREYTHVAVDASGSVYAYVGAPEPLGTAWKSTGSLIRIMHLPLQPNWAQQCWTIDELKDIVKEMKAAEKNAELSEAEQFCKSIYLLDAGPFGTGGLHKDIHGIGKRIAEREAQS